MWSRGVGLKKCVETGENVWGGGYVWEGKARGGEVGGGVWGRDGEVEKVYGVVWY